MEESLLPVGSCVLVGEGSGGSKGRHGDLSGDEGAERWRCGMDTDLVGRITGVDGQDGDGAIALDNPGNQAKVQAWRRMEKRCTDHFSTAYIW